MNSDGGKAQHIIPLKPLEKIKWFPEEVDALRALPLPRTYSSSSGYVLRTSGHGTGSISFKDTTGEIGFNRAEGYINPHFREDEWRASLQHVIARYSIKRGEREK